MLAGLSVHLPIAIWVRTSATPPSGSIFQWLFLLSWVLVYLAGPLFGILSLRSIRHHWQTPNEAETSDVHRVRTTLRRFVATSLLLSSACLFPIVQSVIGGTIGGVVSPVVWTLWCAVIGLTATALGGVSFVLCRKRRIGSLPRAGAAAAIFVGVVATAGAFVTTSRGSYYIQRVLGARPTPTFVGQSDTLKQTVVIPTLDSPSDPGKNVIWCSSFQLAWNEIRDNVIGAPLQVVGAAEVASRLNQASERRTDLEPQSVYAAGGWIRDGIVERIEKDMAAKFPSQELPDFNDYKEMGGILAYSYLTAHVPFTHPFRQVDGGFAFADSQGRETNVRGFGLWQAFLSRYEKIREQIEVLYVGWEDPDEPWGPMKEYALDLGRHTEPYQVVVAVVEPKGTLAETYEHLQYGIEQFKKRGDYERARGFQEADELQVPELFYRVDHRFAELIGKTVANVGMPIVEAMQTIEFRLDRSGALLESQALIAIAATPREFLFDRPFLIYMKKRDAERPFFVMWVDNAELLVRR